MVRWFLLLLVTAVVSAGDVPLACEEARVLEKEIHHAVRESFYCDEMESKIHSYRVTNLTLAYVEASYQCRLITLRNDTLTLLNVIERIEIKFDHDMRHYRAIASAIDWAVSGLKQSYDGRHLIAPAAHQLLNDITPYWPLVLLMGLVLGLVDWWLTNQISGKPTPPLLIRTQTIITLSCCFVYVFILRRL